MLLAKATQQIQRYSRPSGCFSLLGGRDADQFENAVTKVGSDFLMGPDVSFVVGLIGDILPPYTNNRTRSPDAHMTSKIRHRVTISGI